MYLLVSPTMSSDLGRFSEMRGSRVFTVSSHQPMVESLTLLKDDSLELGVWSAISKAHDQFTCETEVEALTFVQDRQLNRFSLFLLYGFLFCPDNEQQRLTTSCGAIRYHLAVSAYAPAHRSRGTSLWRRCMRVVV